MNRTTTERILDLAMQIQQISSPTFGEEVRAKFVFDRFVTAGALETSIDRAGNVITLIKGRGVKPPLVISAHLDTVFPMGTDLTSTRTEDKIFGPGIGDNALGLAGLFGVYWKLRKKRGAGRNAYLPGDIWLVANVGEEGLGDLAGMKAIVDRFGGEPLAYLVLEGMSLGQVYSRGLGVRRYRIHVNTKGGHSWVDYGNPSAIHEIAELVIWLKNVPVPEQPRSSLNVGMIKGGTSVNTIAAEASLELDLRSESPRELTRMLEQVEAIVKAADIRGGDDIKVSAEVIGDRPAGEIAIDHPLVKTAIDCFARQSIPLKLNIGSTDANVPLSRGYPALCFGLTTGGGSHTTGEYINTAPLIQGYHLLIDLIQSIFRIE
jgi:tripeptide aminopeptidase